MLKTMPQDDYRLGTYARRLEDESFLTGKRLYVDDIKMPNICHVGIVRSTYAHAKINRVDFSEALRKPQIIAVLDGKSASNITKPNPRIFEYPEAKHSDCYCLATDKVRFVGEAVAALVAEDRYLAEDALPLVHVDYEPLQAVTNAELAISPDAPLLYENWRTNIQLGYRFTYGPVEERFRQADHVFSEKLKIHRHTGTPIETRGYLAEYGNGFLNLWGTIATPHIHRTQLAEILEIPESNIRVITPSIGGGFGIRNSLYPEEILVCLLAIKTGRPVKWIETRREHMLSANHAREQTHIVSMAVRSDGKILALKDRIFADLGAYQPTPGSASVMTTAYLLPGPYKIEAYSVEVEAIVTNKSPYGAYRGFGKDSACFVTDRMIDIAARQLRLDPAEMRKRNFVSRDEFPYTSVTGAVYDGGDYEDCLFTALKVVGYPELRKKQLELRESRSNKELGIGIAYGIEAAGAATPDTFRTGLDSATVRINPHGKVTVLAGVLGTQGQGHETTLAQIAAESLGIEIADVTVIEGDTTLCPYGLGAWSDRGSTLGAPSVMGAANKLREKITRLAAHLLEARVEDIQIEKSRIYVKGTPEKGFEFRQIARLFYTSPHKLPIGMEPGLEATFFFKLPGVTYMQDEFGRRNRFPCYPNGAYVAVVEVDIEIGSAKVVNFVMAHDCGKIINHRIVEGQLHGGIAQGVGGAILEELRYDETGQLLCTSFMDYLIPCALDIPNIELVDRPTPCPTIPGGFRGVGEGGVVGGYAAVANAVDDALAHFGCKVTDLPLTQEKVWKLTHSEQA